MSESLSSTFFVRAFSILPTLRKPRNFFLYILPFSIVFGRIIPTSYASTLNDVGLAMVQLIAFPAIPLVLSAVMISIANIFGSNTRSQLSRIRFSGRFLISISLTIVLAALLAILLSIYQSPGILSPEGKLSIGRFMLDVTDIRVGSTILDTQVSSDFWITKIVPSNIIADASQGQTLRVITGSVLAGFAMSKLKPSLTQPLFSVLRSVNSTSVQVLNIVLSLFNPVLTFCFALVLRLA